MGYRRFEELPVWQAAVALARSVFDVTDDPGFPKRSGLRDQLERATISVSNNVAEGFERGTHNELISFLYIARGSTAEVRSMLHLVRTIIDPSSPLESRISNLVSQSESISRQLGAWINSLKDSGYQGHRNNTTQTRQAAESRSRRQAFLEQLEALRRPGFPTQADPLS